MSLSTVVCENDNIDDDVIGPCIDLISSNNSNEKQVHTSINSGRTYKLFKR